MATELRVGGPFASLCLKGIKYTFLYSLLFWELDKIKCEKAPTIVPGELQLLRGKTLFFLCLPILGEHTRKYIWHCRVHRKGKWFNSWKNGFCSSTNWIFSVTLPLTTCITLGNFSHFLSTWFPSLGSMGDIDDLRGCYVMRCHNKCAQQSAWLPASTLLLGMLLLY